MPYIAAFLCTSFMLIARPNAGYPALGATVCLLGATYFCARWFPGLSVRNLVFSSSCIAIGGFFRWDFGMYGLAALGVTVVFLLYLDRRPRRAWCPALAASFLPACLLSLLVYVPLLIRSDAVRWYREVFYFHLFEFSKYRGIEHIKPAYWRLKVALENHNFIQLLYGSNDLILVFVPALLPFIALAGIYVARRSVAPGSRITPSLVQSVYIGFLCILLMNQMRIRPTLWQGLPSAVTSLILIPCVIRCFNWKSVSRYMHGLVHAAALVALSAILLAVTFASLGIFLYSIGENDLSSFPVPRATGIRIGPECRYYPSLIQYIRSKTQARDYLFSGVPDHSRLFINDALLYFLCDRKPANRFVQMDSGVANTASAQTEIVKSLQDLEVPLVVLLGNQQDIHPNSSAVSNNVHLVDSFIKSRYVRTKEFGPYAVYERK